VIIRSTAGPRNSREFILEHFAHDTKDRMLFKSMTEEEVAKTSSGIISGMVELIKSKMESVDFKIADKTMGSVAKLKCFGIVDGAVASLASTARGLAGQTGGENELVRVSNEIATAWATLKFREKDFMVAYREGNQTLTLLYALVLYNVIHASSLAAIAYFDTLKGGTEGKAGAIESSDAYGPLGLPVEVLSKFNRLVSSGQFDRIVKVTRKHNVNVMESVSLGAMVVFSMITLVYLVRTAIYLYYYFRVYISSELKYLASTSRRTLLRPRPAPRWPPAKGPSRTECASSPTRSR